MQLEVNWTDEQLSDPALHRARLPLSERVDAGGSAGERLPVLVWIHPAPDIWIDGDPYYDGTPWQRRACGSEP